MDLVAHSETDATVAASGPLGRATRARRAACTYRGSPGVGVKITVLPHMPHPIIGQLYGLWDRTGTPRTHLT
eukprot:2136354-Prymnesium_polylepis.1